jgi:hypothetical protein
VLKGCGSLEAVWNESCNNEPCARHMTRNRLYLYGDLSIREKHITKSTNQIFGKHISKHLESRLEGSELASWARHFPFGMPSLASAGSDDLKGHLSLPPVAIELVSIQFG